MSNNVTVDFIEVLIKRYIDKQYSDNTGYEVKNGLISDTMDTTLFKVLVSLQDGSKEVNVKASDVCFRENIELDQIEEYFKVRDIKYAKSDINARVNKLLAKEKIEQVKEQVASEYDEKDLDEIDAHMKAIQELYKQGFYKEAANNIRQVLEYITENLIIKYIPELSLDDNVGSRIEALSGKKIIDSSQTRSLYNLRNIGNAGSHKDGVVTEKDIMKAIPVLQNLIEYYKKI
ncbi:MAG: DUF4145 domain-containing protein [Cellulosilyticum sp.]|nr:DUF4145 domain-containing protein [Cellulosilyticum sp.]